MIEARIRLPRNLLNLLQRLTDTVANSIQLLLREGAGQFSAHTFGKPDQPCDPQNSGHTLVLTGRPPAGESLRQQPVHDLPLNIGQPEPSALELVRKLGVFDPQKVENC